MRPLLGLIVAATIVLLLRSTALSALATRNIVIDVLAFATVVWALRHGEAWGSTFGFFVGLFADLDAAHWLGRHALALTLLGYGVGRLSRTLVRDSSRTQFALLVAATAAHQAWSAAFELGGGPSGLPYVAARLGLATLATATLGTLLLWIGRRLVGRSLFYASGSSSTS